MKKLLTTVILCVLLTFSLCACSSNDKETVLSTEQPQTETQTVPHTEETTENQAVTEEETETSIPYKITEKEAQEIAYEALKKQSAEGEVGSVEDFTLYDTTLLAHNEQFMAYNGGYRDTAETENLTGNSYYVVEYKYNRELCDRAYYCIDAMNGDVLFEGYMSD